MRHCRPYSAFLLRSFRGEISFRPYRRANQYPSRFHLRVLPRVHRSLPHGRYHEGRSYRPNAMHPGLIDDAEGPGSGNHALMGIQTVRLPILPGCMPPEPQSTNARDCLHTRRHRPISASPHAPGSGSSGNPSHAQRFNSRYALDPTRSNSTQRSCRRR